MGSKPLSSVGEEPALQGAVIDGDRTVELEVQRSNGPSATGSSTSSRDARSGYRVMRLAIAASDALCVAAALLCGDWLVFGGAGPHLWIALAVTPVLWVVVFNLHGLYGVERMSPWDEARQILSAGTTGIVLTILISYSSKASFSRAWIGLTWLFALALELLVRKWWRWYLHRRKVAGALRFRTLIVGADDVAASLARALAEPGSGHEPVGYIATPSTAQSANGIPVLGGLDELADIVRRAGANSLFVSASVTESEATSAARIARVLGLPLNMASRFPKALRRRLDIYQVGDTIAVGFKPATLAPPQAFMKRCLDLALAIPATILTLPLMGLIAAVVKLSSPGPALFKQPRVGKAGRVFHTFKFRTMVADADRAAAEAGIDTSAPFYKAEDDPRITPIGRLLRRLSLDELPQLFNVLRGEMSLVGPRPLPKDQVDANPRLLEGRLDSPAGLTGWWQIHGRSATSAEDAVQMDLFYIDNWSLSLDVYILVKTVGAVLSRRGAV